MTPLAALALTVLVLLAVSGAATQLAKTRKALRSRRRKAVRRLRTALGPQTVARTRRKTARKGNRR
ncbi:hypothetical protein HFP72_20535 [Nocardiopsis sp. ARC36]